MLYNEGCSADLLAKIDRIGLKMFKQLLVTLFSTFLTELNLHSWSFDIKNLGHMGHPYHENWPNMKPS